MKARKVEAALAIKPEVPVAPAKPSKYRNKKTTVDGIVFDSRKEAARYGELKSLLEAGEISDLRIHPPYSLEVKGVKLGKYLADFAYLDAATQREIVEDVKGVKTAVYRLKKKLVWAIYRIKIVEV